MPQIPVRNGWGVQSSLVAVQSNAAGVNSVIPNSGLGIAVIAGEYPQRLTKLSWRVDIAPDQPAGTVSGPTRYRVLVIDATQFPVDVSVWQAQAFPLGSHPEIPQAQGTASPNKILTDRWLDFSAGDPGLNVVASEEWADAGPRVSKGNTLCVMLIPIIDANLAQVLQAASNANLYLEAYGRDAEQSYSAAGNAGIGDLQAGSIPRYDVRIP